MMKYEIFPLLLHENSEQKTDYGQKKERKEVETGLRF